MRDSNINIISLRERLEKLNHMAANFPPVRVLQRDENNFDIPGVFNAGNSGKDDGTTSSSANNGTDVDGSKSVKGVDSYASALKKDNAKTKVNLYVFVKKNPARSLSRWRFPVSFLDPISTLISCFHDFGCILINYDLITIVLWIQFFLVD